MANQSSDSPTPPSMLLRIRDPGDSTSWATFVDSYGPLVYRHCRRHLRHEDAENVTQEVFLQVSQSIRTFEYQPERGGFRHWLGTVTRSKILRFFRQEGGQVPVVQGGGEDLGLNNLEAREEGTAWTEAFNAHVLELALRRSRPHFEEPTWRAFELVWLENVAAPEAARRLGVSVDRVYVAKARVLERLHREVRELADDSIVAIR